MILFKPEHVPPILAGTKTETRRLGNKRWNISAIHQCRTSLFGEPFAFVAIVDVYREWLFDISPLGARREGYPSVAAYISAFYAINDKPKTLFEFEWMNPLVWVVEFGLADCPENEELLAEMPEREA